MRNFANKYGLTEVHAYDYMLDDPRLSDDPLSGSTQMIAKWVDGYGKQLILYIEDKSKDPSGDNIRVFWQKSAGFDGATTGRGWLDEDTWKYFLNINESQEFQRGQDPLKSMGLGLYGIIDAAAEKEGLTEKSGTTILGSPTGPKIGDVYRWTDKTMANEIELEVYDNGKVGFFGFNSEEGTVSFGEIESIMDFFKTGEFNKWINLE